MSSKKYICELKQHKRFNDVAYVIVPFITNTGKNIRVQLNVKGIIDGVPFRKSLAYLGNSEYILVINKKILQLINKTFGDSVEIELEKSETKEISLEDTFLNTLKTFPLAFKRFNQMPQNFKNEYINFLHDSNNEDDNESELSKLSKIKNIIDMFNN